VDKAPGNARPDQSGDTLRVVMADVGHFIVAALESDSYEGATVLLSN
jgi:hypothetical protein